MSQLFDDVPAWPTANTAPAAQPAIGHNKPPLDEQIKADFKERLAEVSPKFNELFDQYIEAADRAYATDDASLKKCGDLVKAYRGYQKDVDEAHTAVKAPYLEAGRLVDAEKNVLIAKIKEARAKVEAVGNAFTAKREAEARAERERQEREARIAAEAAAKAEAEAAAASAAAVEAERQSGDDAEATKAAAAEAARKAEQAMTEAALASASSNAKAEPLRTDTGAAIGTKRDWHSKITDYKAAFNALWDDPKVQEAMDKAAQRRVKAGTRAIEGVEIWSTAKMNVR